MLAKLRQARIELQQLFITNRIDKGISIVSLDETHHHIVVLPLLIFYQEKDGVEEWTVLKLIKNQLYGESTKLTTLCGRYPSLVEAVYSNLHIWRM